MSDPVILYRGWYIYAGEGFCWIDRDGEEPLECSGIESAYRIIDSKMDGRPSYWRRALGAIGFVGAAGEA